MIKSPIVYISGPKAIDPITKNLNSSLLIIDSRPKI